MRMRRGSLEGSGQATGKSDPEVQSILAVLGYTAARPAAGKGRGGRWGDRWCEGGMGRPSQRSTVLAFGLGSLSDAVAPALW